MKPVLHSSPELNRVWSQRFSPDASHWTQKIYPDRNETLVAHRFNFFQLGTLARENFKSLDGNLHDFGLLPTKNIFHRYLDYLHEARKVLGANFLHADTFLLFLLWKLQESGISEERALAILSGIITRPFGPPILSVSEDPCSERIRSTRILEVYNASMNGPFSQHPIEQRELLIHTSDIHPGISFKTLVKNYSSIYLFGILDENLELSGLAGNQSIHVQSFFDAENLLQTGLRAIHHGIKKVIYFLSSDELPQRGAHVFQTLQDLGLQGPMLQLKWPPLFDPPMLSGFIDGMANCRPATQEFLHYYFYDIVGLINSVLQFDVENPSWYGDLEPRVHQKILRDSELLPPTPKEINSSHNALLVSQYNYFRIGSIVEQIYGINFPNFDMIHRRDLSLSFMHYLETLKHQVPAFHLEFADSSILEILWLISNCEERFKGETHNKEDQWIYFLRLAGILSDHAFVGPHTVHIDVTSKCNTKCTFCGYHTPLISDRPWAANGWDQLSVDYELFTRMIDDLKKAHTTEDILLTGGGEPLMHPRILDMIEYIKQRDMHIILFTNGMLLHEDTSHKLIDLGLDKIYWSIHSASSPTWIIQHPGSTEKTFPKVIEQMRSLLKYRNSKTKKDPVIVMVNVLSGVNVHEVLDMVDLAGDLGIDELRFQVMHYGNEQTDHMMLTSAQIRELFKLLPEIRNRAQNYGIDLLENFEFQLTQLLDFHEKGSDLKSCDWAYNLYNNTGCFVGYFFSRTWVDGRMSFCCHDRVAGDLKKGGFQKNWFSDEYQNYRYVAKHFDDQNNINMNDGHKGGWLLADDCSWCGNYEFMNRANLTLNRTGLGLYLDVGLSRTYHNEKEPEQNVDNSTVIIGSESFKPREFFKLG